RPAAGFDVVPGGVKVAGVPGVGDVRRAGGVVQQAVHFACRVAAADAPHGGQVSAFHADQQVVAVVVGAGQLAGGLAGAGDAVLGQLAPGGRVDGVAVLLAAGAGGCRLELGPAAGFGRQVLEDK